MESWKSMKTSDEEIGPVIFESSPNHLELELELQGASTCNNISTQIPSSNCLHLLRCPATNSCLAFFPTGSDLHQIGFLVLSVNNSQSNVKVFTSTPHHTLTSRIISISVNPLIDCQYNSGNSSIIGYLLAYTCCSVNYYNVRITREASGEITPMLESSGNRFFQNCEIAHACWSPHVTEESLVLLQNGDLYIFDIDSPELTGEKVNVLWGDKAGIWLSCDFSWHPRCLIVVHSATVFLVNSSSTVIPLLKSDVSHDRFVAFSIAHDRLYYTLVSNHTVYLCDIRRPMVPLLRWTHNVANPSYVSVSSLSHLRSQSEDYSWASRAGYGIVLGSFWSCQFSILCYGPDVSNTSYYAWGLPSDLSLTKNECLCGSCLVKQEFSKDQLPKWVKWQDKKKMVLGFAVLDKEISCHLFESDKFGGFTVVTLTSAGTIKLQRYCASWGYSEKGHVEQPLGLDDSVLCERENKCKKKYEYHTFEWLDGYLKAHLAGMLSKELATKNRERVKVACIGQEFHELVCQKLRSDEVVRDIISAPTSIHEIALMRVWANLPKNVLRFGFSRYSDLTGRKKDNNLPIEFLEVPSHHLPPFLFRSPSSRATKWTAKQQPSSSLVGPVTPIPFLMTFHMLNAERTADSEIDHECNQVIKSHPDDDNEEQPFGAYKPTSMGDFDFMDEKHANIMFKKNEKDSDFPFKFMNDASFESNEFKILDSQISSFIQGFRK